MPFRQLARCWSRIVLVLCMCFVVWSVPNAQAAIGQLADTSDGDVDDQAGLYIVTVRPASRHGADRRLFHGGEREGVGSRSGHMERPMESARAEDVLHELFHAHARRLSQDMQNGSSTKLPVYSVPYSFQHAGLASRISLVHVDGLGLGVLKTGVQGAILASVAASRAQQGTVASFGDRIDLDAEIGGIGGIYEGDSFIPSAADRLGAHRRRRAQAGMGGGGIDAEPPKPRTITRAGSTQGIDEGAAGNASSVTVASGRLSQGSVLSHSILEETPVANWALDRIDQREPVLDGVYRFSAAATVDEDGLVPPGEGVDVYVVDTGVRPDHVEFERFIVTSMTGGTVGSVQEEAGTAEPVDGPWDTSYAGNRAGDEQVPTSPAQPRVGVWPPQSSRDVTRTVGVTTVPVPSPSPALSVPFSNTRVEMSLGTNTIDDQPATDASDPCHGHGTMVASLAAGSTVGAARGGTIIPIRVIGCSGRFMVVDVLKGLDYALSLAERRRAELGRRAVINLSARCFGICTALDEAAAASREAGILFMTVAGNEGKDACLTSPSRSPDALAVAATRLSDGAHATSGAGSGTGTGPGMAGDRGSINSARNNSKAVDEWAAFSNWGSCVAIAAPGQMVYGASLRGSGQYAFWSGTSFATPVVAGAAAALWAQQPQLPLACLTALLTTGLATTGTLRFTSLPEAGVSSAGTPRRMLYLPPWPLPLLSGATGRTSQSSAANRTASMADSPSTFAWPSICLNPEPEAPPSPEAVLRALLRRPPVSLAQPSDPTGGAAGVEEGIVQEDATCTPVRDGQMLRWDCRSNGGHGTVGEDCSLSSMRTSSQGMVQAVVELAVDPSVFYSHQLASWAVSFVQDEGKGTGTIGESMLSPLQSALASLRSALGTSLTSKLPSIALAALEVCVAPLHGQQGYGLHCMYLPVRPGHRVNAGLRTGQPEGSEEERIMSKADSVCERWRVTDGSEWLVRAYVRSTSPDPESAAALLRSWSSVNLLSDWATVHRTQLLDGLHVKAARIPRDEIQTSVSAV